MTDIDELQKQIDKITNRQNQRGLADFEGYSPLEMQYILYDTFGENSPIKFLKMEEFEYQQVPILKQIKYLLKIIENQNELKLTNKGYLPPRIVAEIYNQGFIKDKFIEAGISKLYRETDCSIINLTRIISELSGIVKKRNNILSLTKTGKSIVNNDFDLLFRIFTTFAGKFNWAYYDGYGQNNIGQLGFGFTLILLSKYGDKKRPAKYYADKYFKAFPRLIDEISESDIISKQKKARTCYTLRTFERFLNYFGLVNIESENTWITDKFISKTEIFDKLIKPNPDKPR